MLRYLKVEIDRDSLIKQNKQFNSIEYKVYLEVIMTVSEIKSIVESSKKLSFEEKFTTCLLRLFYEDMAFELAVEPKDECKYDMHRLLLLVRMCLDDCSCHVKYCKAKYCKDTSIELDKIYNLTVEYADSDFKCKNKVSEMIDLIIHDLNKRNYTVNRTDNGFTVSGWNR